MERIVYKVYRREWWTDDTVDRVRIVDNDIII